MTNEPDEKTVDASYHKYIETLDAIKTENERLLARNTLVISGGAFTLSVTLLKDLYANPMPWTQWFLIASWIVFGMCAFLQFYSDHLSTLAIECEKEHFKKYWQSESPGNDRRSNIFNTRVKAINSSTPWIICIGFFCIIIFSASNFLYGKGDQMKETITSKTVEQGNNATTESEKRGVTLPARPEKPKPAVNDKPKPKPENQGAEKQGS